VQDSTGCPQAAVMADEQASGRRRSFSMPSVEANSARLSTMEPTSVGLRPLMSTTSHTVSVSVFLAYFRRPSASCEASAR
jgi:hypothetical protein